MTPVELVLSKLQGVRPCGNGWMARCPSHDDSDPSLKVDEGEDGKVLLDCKAACPTERVVDDCGLTMADLFPRRGAGPSAEVARYHYTDAEGRVQYVRKRFLGPDGAKNFAYFHPDGETKGKPKGVAFVLYRLPLLAYAEGQTVFIAEGEKDVEALLALDQEMIAITSGAAGSWRESFSIDVARARPARVVVLGDNDGPGRKHAHEVSASLSKRGLPVKVLFFEGGKGYDVADWLRDGGDLDQLHARVEAAEQWLGDEKADSAAVEDLPTFLNRLASAPPLGWHVPGLIPDEGICLWHGQPRDFKSMCAQEVALALASGRAPFALGRFEVRRPVRVAYFSEEDPERLFAARMRWLTAKTSVPSLLLPFIRRSMSFDSEEGQAEVLLKIQACQAEVVFFDPLRSFTGQSDKGPADFAPVARFLRRIQDETTAKTLVIPHHDTKPLASGNPNPDRSRSQQASGGGIFSISDCPVSFRKLNWNHVAVFPEDYKLTGDPRPFEVVFETDAWVDENGAPRFGTWVRPVATTKDEKDIGVSVNRDKLLAFLSANEGQWFSTGDVGKGAGIRTGAVAPALEDLRSDGLVVFATGPRAKALGRHPNAQLWTWAESLLSSQSLLDRREENFVSLPPPLGEETNTSTSGQAVHSSASGRDEPRG